MKVLVACESSGVVREAFRARGHIAWSCDILSSEDDSHWHIQDDVLNVLKTGWAQNHIDLMIAHPPCTYLCNSGVHLLSVHPYKYQALDALTGRQDYVNKVNERWNQLALARAFFMALWDQPIPKICIENPVPHKYGMLPKYSQTIQPYQFGNDASKRTCLWLKGLPKLLVPSEDQWAQPRFVDGKPRWSNQTDGGWNRLGPSKTRASERSRTYDGIAKAFAEQWG